MKRSGVKADDGSIVALALTWDGVRHPVRSLPARARALLEGGKRKAVPSRTAITKLFVKDRIEEIRICWVPRLRGGPDVLGEPFSLPGGKRLAFRAVRRVMVGDLLVAIYRRARAGRT